MTTPVASAAPAGQQRLYGPWARFARRLLRLFTPRYTCTLPDAGSPCVYVCRHLNMHGPLVTMTWLPMELHPFVLSVFTDEKQATVQFRDYTFSRRFGREPRSFSLAASVAGWLSPKVIRAVQPVPVHRDMGATSTLREALRFLLKGESVIVWPDVHYTDGYDKPCEIYQGFLLLGEMYHRKTGQELPFVPLYIDDQKRTVTSGVPLVINQYRQDCQRATHELQEALDGRD